MVLKTKLYNVYCSVQQKCNKFFVSEMCDSDIEVPEKEKERSKQSTLSNELDVLNENRNGQLDSNIRK